MLDIDKKVKEVGGANAGEFPHDVLASTEPLVLKGLVANWPFVQSGKQSTDAAIEYLRRFYDNATIGAFFGEPDIDGRVFYNEDMTGFNYQPVMLKLDQFLEKIQQHASDEKAPALYVGSTTVDTCLPGFRAENDIDFGDLNPLASIWMGNRTRIAAHYDLPDNIACNVVGHRRFTVFPPEELENLYAGPIDFTPAGQTISLVDFHRPDFDKYPKFKNALKSAQVAELEPGDAIFIPSMWWHHVEALDTYNVLINYWWRQSPAYMGPPVDVLMHALLTIRDLPATQREAWHGIFKHYVFEADDETAGHIPEHRRGVLAPMNERMARELRAHLLNNLNR